MDQTSRIVLSKERVKQWIREKMGRGRWICVHDIPHLKSENFQEFVTIVKEMIDGKQYGDEKIWIELDKDHLAVKIYEYSGFYKQKKSK